MRHRIAGRLSPRFYRTALTLVLVIPVFYLTVIGGLPFISVFSFPGRIRLHWVAGLILGGWLVWKWIRREELMRSPLDGPILAGIAAAGLATIASTDTRLSAERLLALLTYVLAFYFLLDLRAYPGLWRSLIDAMLIVVGIVGLLGLLQLFWWAEGRGFQVVGLTPPRISVLGNPNILAAYLVLITPLFVQRLLNGHSWIATGLLVGLLTLSLGMLLLSGSRSGLAGLISETVLGLWLIWKARRSSHRRWLWLLIALLILTIGAVSLGVISRRGLRLTGSTMRVRYETWQASLRTWIDHPLLGTGPGTFGAQLLRYRDGDQLREIHSHAHNLYLTIAAEAGALGLGALAWGAVVLFRRSTGRAATRFGLPTACLIGLTGWGVQSLADTFLDYPVIILHVLVLAGGALPRSLRRGGAARRPRLAAASGLAVVVMIGALSVNRGFAAHRLARQSAMGGDWGAAQAQLELAVRRDPQNGFYRQEEAFAHGVEACTDSAQLPMALALYRARVETFDYWALDHANLAALAHRAGDDRSAIQHMVRAHALEPQRALYLCKLGEYDESAGQLSTAREHFGACLAQSPNLVDSPYWHETAWRSSAITSVVALAHEALPAPEESLSPAVLHRGSGDCEAALRAARAFRLANPDHPAAQVEEASALFCLGQKEAALEILNNLLETAPSYGSAWLLQGQIYLSEGATEEAYVKLAQARRLGNDAQGFYWFGRAAEARGNHEEAIASYRQALALATRPYVTQFAPWVAHRLPLPQEQLPCLVVPHPRDRLAAPALALGRLLESLGRCEEVRTLYQALIDYDAAPAAANRLHHLTCAHQ